MQMRGKRSDCCRMPSCVNVSGAICCSVKTDRATTQAALMVAVGGLAADVVPLLTKTNDPKGAEETLMRNVEDSQFSFPCQLSSVSQPFSFQRLKHAC